MATTPSKQSATVAPVTASATVVTLWPAVTGTGVTRRFVFNDADKILFIKFGSAASLTDWSVKIAAGGLYEFPLPIYAGQVTGIWEAAPTGQARLTAY